jgi:hypothetical protein
MEDNEVTIKYFHISQVVKLKAVESAKEWNNITVL